MEEGCKMVELVNKKIVGITHYHLADELNEAIKYKGDLVIVSDLNKIDDKHKNVNLQKTFVLDLKQFSSCDEIKSDMCSTIRNSINFCKSNNVTVEFFDKDISICVLKDFIKTLKTMYKQKHFKSKIVNIKTLIKYSKNDNLLISRTIYNDSPISYHVYIKDSFDCVLWFSCSLFRGVGNSNDKNFVGKCNRYHHFEDICYFYEKKYSSYDWGGVSSFDSPNGIDLFKFSFPGVKTTKYEIMMPLTWKGNLYLKLKGYTFKK